MRRGERDAQSPADEHHDDLAGTAVLRQILGVPGKRHPGIVDHAFLDRRSHHRIVFAAETAADRPIEYRQHVAAVSRIELAGQPPSGERHMLDLRTAGEELTVADRDDWIVARHPSAQLWPYA